ncbi:hypothetical protein C8R47DRAFT_1230950 [Mycena vitilis]|nr:hypothetical protein C8R47DRAFT_1085034 [Mycena vitilis]KAJ6448658.1 hypothetical protein C8R47DRAFT_1230950 [Mycena vitilis]
MDVPPEIMALIFTFAREPGSDPLCTRTAEGHDHHRIFANKLLCPPWVLSSVCRYWREVALGLPTLWSEISVRATRQYNVAGLVAQLERSKNVPLTIAYTESMSVVGSRPPDPMHPFRDAEALSLLAAVSHRWEKATLYMGFGRYRELGIVAGNLPLLRCLSLTVENHYFHRERMSVPQPFVDAPLLTTLRVAGFDGYCSHPTFPIHQLERMAWKGSCRVGPPRTLSFDSLHHLEILGPLCAGFKGANLSLVRSLIISSTASLAHLILPALTHLTLRDETSGQDTSHNFAYFLRQSPGTHLVSLSISIPGASLPFVWALYTVLEACPSLRHLGVSTGMWMRQLIGCLKYDTRSTVTPAGAHLTSLRFEFTSPPADPLDQWAIIGMARSRHDLPPDSPCARLENLTIEGGGTLGRDVRAAIASLRAGGMRIVYMDL